MKKLLHGILATTMVLSMTSLSFAEEITVSEDSQAIHSQTLSTTNFPSASQLPDYAVKAFSSVLGDLPHTMTENGYNCTLSVCYFDYLGNGDPLMYTMYYHKGTGGVHDPEIWGAKPDGTPVKAGSSLQNGFSPMGSVLYKGKTYLMKYSSPFGPDSPYTATMYSYAKGVFATEVNTMSWYKDWENDSSPTPSHAELFNYTLLFNLVPQLGGGVEPDFTDDFKKYSKLASVASAELKAQNTTVPMVSGTIDVPTNAWYASYVEYALEKGIMDATSSVFRPEEKATRGEVAATMSAGIGATYTGNIYSLVGEMIGHGFSDAPSGEGEGYDVEMVCDAGLMTGYSNSYFGYYDNITREQFALILKNLATLGELYKTPSSNSLSQFSDSGSVSSWAKDAVVWAVANGYMSGSEGKLNPQGDMSRAELATIMTSFYKKNNLPKNR